MPNSKLLLASPLSLTVICLLVVLSCIHAMPTSQLEDDQHLAESFEDQFEPEQEVMKRLGSFVRIGRPSSFVRIGRPHAFLRIGRPGNFVRIGRSDGGEDEILDSQNEDDEFYDGAEKRAPHFVRIGKSPKFVRIGKSGPELEGKRLSSFVRIGKSMDNSDQAEADKRASAFVRIGKIPSSSFVRIGRNSDSASEEGSEFGHMDRINRMGQSSFVRIGKREAEQVHSLVETQKAADGQSENHH